MTDEVWKDFFTDHQTLGALESSEVWKNYSTAELSRDALRQKRALEEKLDYENKLMSDLDEFRNKVASSPELKAYLKKAAAYLEQHPELRSKVDPNFIMGLELLDLED